MKSEKGTLEISTKSMSPLAQKTFVMRKKLEVADAKIKKLEQAIWDAYSIMSFDTDGDKTPEALVYPSLSKLIVNAAKEFRQDYEDALKEK